MTINALRIHPDDDVACLLRDLDAGTQIVTAQGMGPTLTAAIRMGHKVALNSVPAGAPVRKYGQPIGTATEVIAPGDHVHSHNLKGATR
ncbi:UxaA family hydrolase [Sulfitobacter sp. D35]|uniref:UxaA family hydrolase n=1 Tax=Sulfitobacter sp. D35 TaxID=3083252 RepID=UPI00296EE6E0|nr:UxaA family hydrolase [Sulfitobacter sp. D35]MDW4497211.1 UxaA family hydrolase [Sulfitobacter sp. D35]